MKMMKTMLKLWLMLALPLALTGAVKADSTSTNRIATIDLKKVFDKYYKLDQARKAFEKEKADMDKEYKSRADEAKQALDDYTKLKAAVDDTMISDTERASRKAKADAKLDEVKSYDTELRSYEQQATDKLSLDQQRMMDLLMQDIQTAINAKAKAAGYTLVVDTSARVANGANTLVVLYSNGENDITDEIVKQLNAAAPAVSSDSTSSPAQ
jgi:Skp family chaperone for outer membrane proteins